MVAQKTHTNNNKKQEFQSKNLKLQLISPHFHTTKQKKLVKSGFIIQQLPNLNLASDVTRLKATNKWMLKVVAEGNDGWLNAMASGAGKINNNGERLKWRSAKAMTTASGAGKIE